MKGAAPTVTVLDLYGDADSVLASLRSHITDSASVSPRLLICLSPIQPCLGVGLQQLEDVTVENVITTNKVEALYLAKQKLDEQNACDVTILTSSGHVPFWRELGGHLFTPVHSWSVQAVGDVDQVSGSKSDVGDDDVKEGDVRASLVTYLRGLPSVGDVKYRTSSLLPSKLFTHGFSERHGGISNIPSLRSLNLVYTTKKRDSMLVVEENRRRLGEAAGFDSSTMQMARAEHDCRVRVLGKTSPEAYDAIVARDEEVTLAAPGADCVTLLFADPVHRAFGAAHSGWRGTVRRVAVETVRAMQREYGSRPEDILVAMGPSLEAGCLEFSKEDAGGFYEIDASCVEERQGSSKVFINLTRAIRLTLEREGVLPDHIDVTPSSSCTACHPDSFFSFRRDGFPFGNQCGFIKLNKQNS